MKMVKKIIMQSIQVMVPAVVLFLFSSPSFGQSDFQKQESEFATLIQQVKTGIVAVGTFHFNTKPTIRFSGTGFVIGNGDRIVTNHHVIEAIKKKNRLFHLRIFHKSLPKKGISAVLLAEDEFHDIAILKIKERRLPALKLENTQQVMEGHNIAFTGYPIGFVLGLNPTTHTGIVSAIAPIILPTLSSRVMDQSLIKHLKDPFDVFQIDATAYPGSSGSPVYRVTTGRVVGVINMVFIKGKKEHVLKEPTGITYAIPIKFVHELNQSVF